MKEVAPQEQYPDNNWVLEAYDRIQAPELQEEPVYERVVQALEDYHPDLPPRKSGSLRWTELQIKFSHFSQTLLGTSPDIEAFQRRVDFLYSSEFREYYTGISKRPKDKRLLPGATHVVGMSMQGLAAFCEQHDDVRDAAVTYLADHLLPVSGRYFTVGKSELAKIAEVNVQTFQDQLAGGYFEDVPPTPLQGLAIECLRHLRFGSRQALGATAIHNAIYAPLARERLYHLRTFKDWLTATIEERRQGETPHRRGYEESAVTRMYSDAYEMLRRAASYTAELGSDNAAAILQGLPELQRGQPPARARIIALANALTKQMNKVYFDGAFQLSRLDPSSDTAQLQAFDRIIYVLHKELPHREKNDKTNVNKHHEVLTLVGEIASDLIELVHLKMEARDPVTVGDIIAMFPNASPETLQILITEVEGRFARERAKYSVYLDYRKRVRKKGQLFFNRRVPGRGIIS